MVAFFRAWSLNYHICFYQGKPITAFSSIDYTAAEAAPLREKWGWMVTFGALLALAGFAALGSVVSATVATVMVVGIAMIVSGLVEMVYAILVRSWKKFFLWPLIGLLYLLGGIEVINNPMLAPGFLTLLLGCYVLW